MNTTHRIHIIATIFRAILGGALFFGLVSLTGCTRPNDVGEVATLDQPVRVEAHGTRPRSAISMTREGKLDPDGAALTMMVRDASVKLRSTGGEGSRRIILDEMTLFLDSLDLPPSKELPDGLKLRDGRLVLATPAQAKLVMAAPDSLTVTVDGTLEVHSKMVLADGSLYPLGAIPTEPGTLTVRVTTDGSSANVRVDGAPRGDDCWSLGPLLVVRECALHIDSPATVEAL